MARVGRSMNHSYEIVKLEEAHITQRHSSQPFTHENSDSKRHSGQVAERLWHVILFTVFSYLSCREVGKNVCMFIQIYGFF